MSTPCFDAQKVLWKNRKNSGRRLWNGITPEIGFGRIRLQRIEIIALAITKEEQLDIARLLVKAGYTVSITVGKTVNGKSRRYINYERAEEN